MFNRTFYLFYTLIFVMIIILPITSFATEPTFEMTICSDTTRFNKGEEITFSIYLIGIGNVTNDYMLFYVDDNMFVDSISIMGFEFHEGLQDKGTNAQAFDNFMENAKQGFINYSPDKLNPLYAGIVNNSNYVPPIKVSISTNDQVSCGDHNFKIIYMFSDDNNNWQQVSETMTFHINSLTEEYEFLGFIWSFLPPFLGFGFALLLYSLGKHHAKNKEKHHKQVLKENLSLMIKDEVEFNKTKIGQIKKEAGKGLIPTYRLKTVNKDASWNKIIEFRYAEHDLINRISELYYKYDILNRTIDIGFECFYQKRDISGLLDEIIRICDAIEIKNDEVLSNFVVNK